MNLLDTDIIIELLQKRKHETGAISIIALIELLRGLENTKKRTKAKELLEKSFNIQNLDNQTIETYCNLHQNLKKQGETLPDADLLIAATAIAHNMTLKTRDQHYKRLTKIGLKLPPLNQKQ